LVLQTKHLPRFFLLNEIQYQILCDKTIHLITISYNPDVTGGELNQFLNVLWGNASLFPGVRVIDVEVPDSLTKKFKGPRFGIEGLRKHFDAPTRPLLTTALKPMGSDSKTLAEMARTLALAGFDLIKDDHSLANQPWSKWRERVEIVATAVQEANQITGKNCAYAPSLNLPFDQLLLEYLPGKTVWVHCSYAAPGLPFGGISVLKNKGKGSTLATLNGAAGGKFTPGLYANIIEAAGINRIVAG
jgi:ribulose-bisphosphate carboxylase large chain